MATIHNLGFPRIGKQRELKTTVEQFWANKISIDELTERSAKLQHTLLSLQNQSGLDWIPVGDFSLYDHVLDTSFLLGNIPPRFLTDIEQRQDQYFRVARGRCRQAAPAQAGEMTKWFDTNYHYIVPEFSANTRFSLHPETLLEQIRTAKSAGIPFKPVLLGPLSYLWLGKSHHFNKLELLEQLIPIYSQLFGRLEAAGADWIQLDEPILALDLDKHWQQAFRQTYTALGYGRLKILLTTYFGPLQENLDVIRDLPVHGLHFDAIRAGTETDIIIDTLDTSQVVSVGIIDGRNIWQADLNGLLDRVEPLYQHLGERLWLAPSCSLLHIPLTLESETHLNPELKSWLAFAQQKLESLHTIKQALTRGRSAVETDLAENRHAIKSRGLSTEVNNKAVKEKLETITPGLLQRNSPYSERAKQQKTGLKLPLFPTTTIGSFPQTPDIRKARKRYRDGNSSLAEYHLELENQIRIAIAEQQACGLDVLVHGEVERNDMVEYFGELLTGFALTEHGWVQSYGSRCVKPPIIYGDVSRPNAMTVSWSRYAQSLTDKPVKGILTGPVTMLQWSFVRDDQPRDITTQQIALALREEVNALESAGIPIIQVDEPALREGLPLRKRERNEYLNWAVNCFKLCTSGVNDATQIHTHMCYSKFNDIMESIAALDADVITIETSRSNMKLLDAFDAFSYPNEIGPGVYDIHSPNTPNSADIVKLIGKAAQKIPPERLWINPDCGLKTRSWEEVRPALQNMIHAAQILRAEHTRRGV